MKKRCVECRKEFTSGEFCTSCGGKLEDFNDNIFDDFGSMKFNTGKYQNAEEAIEEKKAEFEKTESLDNAIFDLEKEIKEDKSIFRIFKGKRKKRLEALKNELNGVKPKRKSFIGRLIGSILLILLVLILVFAGLGYLYLRNSQGDLDPRTLDELNTEDYVQTMLSTDFDGESLETRIEEEVINYFIAINKEEFTKVSLPMSLQITDIMFVSDDSTIYFFIEGNGVNTRLNVGIELETSESHVDVIIEKLSLGSSSIPLPKEMILKQVELPEVINDGFDIPAMFSVEEFDVDKNGLEIELNFDSDYANTTYNTILKNIDSDVLALALTQEDNIELQKLALELSVNEMNLDNRIIFFKNLLSSKESSINVLSLMTIPGAKALTEQFVTDFLYLNESYFEDYLEKSQEQQKVLLNQ